VHMLAVEDLGDDTALGREPPVPVPKARQEVADVGDLRSGAGAVWFPAW